MLRAMKEFGYSSAAAIGLLVVTAGLSLAAVIANLPLQDKDQAKGPWKPRSDTLLAQAGTAEPALSQPIEDSFQVSFDPGADLQDAEFVANTQQNRAEQPLNSIQSDEVEALAALSPAAGPLTADPLSPDPAADLLSQGTDANALEDLRPQTAAAALVPPAIDPGQPRIASAELLERSDVAPLKVISLSLVPLESPLPAAAGERDAAVAAAEEPQIAAIPGDRQRVPDKARSVPETVPLESRSTVPATRTDAAEVAAGYVVIGSFQRLDAAAAHVLKHQDWQPTIVAGQVGEKLYQRVVVGPFSESDLGSALDRIVGAGIKDAWRLNLKGKTDLAAKALDVLG